MLSPHSHRRAIPAGARVGFWRARDGWMLRRFDWPADASPRGSILFQAGRGDVFEKYLETLAHWHHQGWSISAFDWRGQGGSGRLSGDPRVGHVEDFALYVADFEEFWRVWRKGAVGPTVAIGHSMGGHLVLRAMAEGCIAPDAAVLVAPMLGLKTPVGAGFGEWAARRIGGRGDGARRAWRGNEHPATTATRQALLTHDDARYRDEIHWQTVQPDLVLGPPSWRWLIEAFASTRLLRADPRLADVRVPVLMLLAEYDQLVSARAALRVAARLPDARVVRFGRECAHEILREVDAVRDRALAEIDAFLAARLGGRP
ncbi:alpha/beta hydrolase [Sphingomonas sp. H39-1-10]|uniref:alpha/beta fold hydrolase n=1 Tax=Sphingomonas pollutisoli TaxID=3030829 RepID=UPI0023B9F1A2|nr:alpha/beta hydrolase [Sphingomonas pollutisoli]MDF0488478.1 alpha/beta hydrolase [Sphingomonas pollutisoli]